MQGEEAKNDVLRQRFALQLAGIADVFVNDAFGSWQPHTSTYDITRLLPSYAGLCMQVRTGFSFSWYCGCVTCDSCRPSKGCLALCRHCFFRHLALCC